MHPHGVLYSKENEGADGNTKGANVLPSESYTYIWVVDEASGPGPNDPSTIVWLYHSHVMAEEEMNLGLVGAIVITRKVMKLHNDITSSLDRNECVLLVSLDLSAAFIRSIIKSC